MAVPPKCWIDACHSNNKPCLGTLITEWDIGGENKKLLKNKTVCIKKLVDLCKFYGFDGYLINIESPVNGKKKYMEMVYFIYEL